MKTIRTKINSTTEKECITDVGEIISMKGGDSFDMDCGHAVFKTSNGYIVATAKLNAVLCCGCTCITLEDRRESFCSDPRVLMMYLWKARQYFWKQPVTAPPIPTREEAVVWLKKMDIPLEPQARVREWTPKLKKNFLNIKD